MTDQIVNEWITEWSQVRDHDKEKVTVFATAILANEDLFQAITHVLEESDRFKPVIIHSCHFYYFLVYYYTYVCIAHYSI